MENQQKISKNEPLNIGVLGDLHGHFTLALTLLKRWENEKEKNLDLILQVGDFGVFPHPFYKLDHATYKFSKKDPDEISFPDYLDSTQESQSFFDEKSPSEKRIDAPLIFIRGNHEDFDYLSQLENSSLDIPIPVDHYSKFLYLPNGKSTSFNSKGKKLTIAGLGGIEHGKYGAEFSNKEVNNLIGSGYVDILLTHEPYKGGFGDGGSRKIKELVNSLEPSYSFSGHYHVDGQKLNSIDNTNSFILNEVNFRRKHKLNKNCVGILEWKSKSENYFNFLDEPWLNEYTRDNFRDISK